MLTLDRVYKNDAAMRECMANHYTHMMGIVGRSICYRISYNGVIYGYIIGGSAVAYLPGRNKYFGVTRYRLSHIINNVFFHIDRVGGTYPCRNFVQLVLNKWRTQVVIDWEKDYGSIVYGFESLVEPPRTGELYIRDKWDYLGMTKGYTAKREGTGNYDGWSGGKRVWNTTDLRPKHIFVRKV